MSKSKMSRVDLFNNVLNNTVSTVLSMKQSLQELKYLKSSPSKNSNKKQSLHEWKYLAVTPRIQIISSPSKNENKKLKIFLKRHDCSHSSLVRNRDWIILQICACTCVLWTGVIGVTFVSFYLRFQKTHSLACRPVTNFIARKISVLRLTPKSCAEWPCRCVFQNNHDESWRKQWTDFVRSWRSYVQIYFW
jgi:hypothetical protein